MDALSPIRQERNLLFDKRIRCKERPSKAVAALRYMLFDRRPGRRKREQANSLRYYHGVDTIKETLVRGLCPVKGKDRFREQ